MRRAGRCYCIYKSSCSSKSYVQYPHVTSTLCILPLHPSLTMITLVSPLYARTMFMLLLWCQFEANKTELQVIQWWLKHVYPQSQPACTRTDLYSITPREQLATTSTTEAQKSASTPHYSCIAQWCPSEYSAIQLFIVPRTTLVRCSSQLRSFVALVTHTDCTFPAAGDDGPAMHRAVVADAHSATTAVMDRIARTKFFRAEGALGQLMVWHPVGRSGRVLYQTNWILHGRCNGAECAANCLPHFPGCEFRLASFLRTCCGCLVSCSIEAAVADSHRLRAPPTLWHRSFF